MKCLKCGKSVFTSEEEREPDKFVINPTKNPRYENDTDGQFSRCPYCKARNYTKNLLHAAGEPLRKIFSHCKEFKNK
jgi:predicted nucleic-acid-binding Zn-ribbon protein